MPVRDVWRSWWRPTQWAPLAAALAATLVFSRAAHGQTPASPPPPADPNGDRSLAFRSIYSNGDLILVHPQQSIVIFLCVVVSSTAVEYLIEVLGAHPNKYMRIIFFAIKEELTCIGFAEMVLLFIAFSFNLARQWRVVIQWVAMCLLVLAATFAVMITLVVALSRMQAQRWRAFEWAKIDADAHHDMREELFKASRAFFLEKVMAKLEKEGSQTIEIPLVTFSTHISKMERVLTVTLCNFTLKTWMGLGFVIVLNGARSITAASTTTNSTIVQIFTFIIVIGYGTLVVYVVMHVALMRRLRHFMLNRIIHESGGEADTQQQQQQQKKHRHSTQNCLFFRSHTATLDMVKMAMLSMMWYVAVLVMAYVYVAFTELQWFALLVYLLALAPPLLMTFLLPWTLNVVALCVALGDNLCERDAAGIHRLLDAVTNEGEEEGGVEGDTQKRRSPDPDHSHGDGLDGGGALSRPSPARELHAQDHSASFGAFDDDGDAAALDEWDGAEVTLHSSVPAERLASVGPQRLMGVAPSGALKQKFQRRQARPVFGVIM